MLIVSTNMLQGTVQVCYSNDPRWEQYNKYGLLISASPAAGGCASKFVQAEAVIGVTCRNTMTVQVASVANIRTSGT